MVISEDKIMNSALDFAMSFGKDWLKADYQKNILF